MQFTEDHLLRRICVEIRHEFNMPDPDAQPISEAEIEACWVFHGGLFYHGVRRQVYGVTPAIDRDQLVSITVETLLGGLPRAMRELLSQQQTAIDE
jgi:hypothetical protein